MKTFFLLSWLVVSPIFAALLEPGGNVVTTIEEVPVKAQAKTSFYPTPLLLTGAGKRVKKIVLLKIDVYVAAHYLDSGTKLTEADPMVGVKAAKAKAIQLTFLRDVDSGKIRDSFSEALRKNNVDMESPVMKSVMARLTFDMKEKQTLTLVGIKQPDGSEVLHFEAPTGPFKVEGPSIATEFWKMWFGEPEDGGLEKLKSALIGSATKS